MRSGDLDRLVRFERPVAATGADGAGSDTWEPVVTVWAQVKDVLPSRGERISEGLTIANRPSRVRIRYRTGLDGSMRLIDGDRIMQIVSGPVMIGRRQWLELMAEDWS